VIDLEGVAASRDEILGGELSRFQILHFATHGVLNDENPVCSGLRLFSSEGNTSLPNTADIFGLYLPADLIVLSDCETGLGDEFKGEGIVGLTRAFMYAGAESLIVSLWTVDDTATAIFMKRFYKELLDRDTTPAEALKLTQLAMLEEDLLEDENMDSSNPYFWAAFTLQGEWEQRFDF
jgi:CHAT domain-containing protein